MAVEPQPSGEQQEQSNGGNEHGPLSALDDNDSKQYSERPASVNQEISAPVQPKQQVGVADYFAVLGVGEELVWKHAQKQQPGISSESQTQPTPAAEEDDARLLERFYREIVDCAIWVADEFTEQSSANYPTTMVYTTINKSQSQPYPVSLPTSPVPSDILSAVGTEVETKELEGWTILQQTRPVSAAICDVTSPGDSQLPPLWTQGQVWEANLDSLRGLTAEIHHLETARQKQNDGRHRKSSTPLKNLREKVQSTFQQRLVSYSSRTIRQRFYLSFRRRAPDESHRPALADLALHYVQIHKATLDQPQSYHQSWGDTGSVKTTTSESIAGVSTVSSKGAAALLRVAEAGKQTFQSRVLRASSQPEPPSVSAQNSMDYGEPVPLDSLLKLPPGLDEWSIPGPYQQLRFPSHPPAVDTPFHTILFPPSRDQDMDGSSAGIEAVEGTTSPISAANWMDRLKPKLVPADKRKELMDDDEEEYIFVPVLAIRRQRTGEEERFFEDTAIVDLTVSFTDVMGKPAIPYEEVDPFEEEDDDVGLTLLKQTDWSSSQISARSASSSPFRTADYSTLGKVCLLVRRNKPLGFCDAAFSTAVQDRFPYKNYKGLPLPEEELPMFCYPTGCRLHRAKFCEIPLPQYYGFVVKNERGDSIYVSCVSFMEPLTRQKRAQLARLSEKRRRVSIPHSRFFAKEQRLLRKQQGNVEQPMVSDFTEFPDEGDEDDEYEVSNMMLTGFEEMTTFENKTICLVSRYPYWSAFRRFLSHLHSVSGSSSDLPIERYISHLLLAVPIPKPGGPNILIPLPTFNVPMMMWLPPSKDLPLLDLPYERLVSCLDIPTIVTTVLGFLALERKVIVMSTRPSLVLDVCELLRSLLFPFELCAPYVPRLTEPFMSCLDFPGAIFVGIHDDGSSTGLAAVVRQNMPEDSTIVDLDSGSVDCSGDRMTVLDTSWGIIPSGPRSVLVSEIETLCRDAGIVPGQEPLDSLVDPAFEATMPSIPVQDVVPLSNEHKEPLDDRAIRDAFLRFFCSILGGYERYLVVPDVDFLISGNEWFDTQGFLASTSEDKAAFLGSLVSTQLFQSFIQRRTESSDVQCLLFDECLTEFHSASVPYGRLGGDVETTQASDSDRPQLLYSLLVDQSATEANQSLVNERSFDAESRPGSDTDSSGNLAKALFGGSDISGEGVLRHSEVAKNATGDWVTVPSRGGLPGGARYLYCVDGNPTFPDRLNPNAYLPRQPESWLVEMTTAPTPMLTRSSKEIEEADRRRKLATTYRGLQTQRRCLWQLPKLMGSHFLGAYLLCVPALVAQPFLTHEQQSKYLLRALGTLRLLRSKQRIVPDEAAYRALIVACGRTMNDRRIELVKLFGILRSDGIFPSAVTLGQYTKALAEGYSKQGATGPAEEDGGGIDVVEPTNQDLMAGFSLKTHKDSVAALEALDRNLLDLEDSGRRWRQKSTSEKHGGTSDKDLIGTQDSKDMDRNRRKSTKAWLPVVFSSSFAPSSEKEGCKVSKSLSKDKIRLVALWSRTTACDSCGYIPLEEEVQAGWDVFGGENDIPGAINCCRCGTMLIPRLGFKDLSMEQAIQDEMVSDANRTKEGDAAAAAANFASLPPQMGPTIDELDGSSYVAYISPSTLRLSLERLMQDHGEGILDRKRLRAADPEVFYNLWWYCARFSLPLPLPIAAGVATNNESHEGATRLHYCAFASWDARVALRGCWSAAKVLTSLLEANSMNNQSDAADTGEDYYTSASAVGAPSHSGMSSPATATAMAPMALEAFGDYPLLARFNLQGYYATVWDHVDLSEILVTLVEACDKRDFRPVVECILQANQRRRDRCQTATASSTMEMGSDLMPSNSDVETLATTTTSMSMGNPKSVTLDGYRVALYLAKYQCTSAFHAFFPATLRPCKGYHFWCPIAPVPIFDRLLHEAVQRVRSKHANSFCPFPDVSDVALGFRCVFGHLI